MNKRYTLEAAEKLRGSDLPILLTWAPGDQRLPAQVRRTAGRRSPQRPHRRDPRRRHLRPPRPARARRRRDRRFVKTADRVPERKKSRFGRFFRSVHVFRLTVGPCFTCLCDAHPTEDGELCPRRSSTRTGREARWREGSTKRSRVVTSGRRHRRAQRRERDGPQSLAVELLEYERQRRRGTRPGAARAVVVGVVEKQDVAGRGARSWPASRSTRPSPAASSPSPIATRGPGASRAARIARRPEALKIP